MSPPEIEAAVHQQLDAPADHDQARSDRQQQYSKLENMERRLGDVDGGWRALEIASTRSKR